MIFLLFLFGADYAGLMQLAYEDNDKPYGTAPPGWDNANITGMAFQMYGIDLKFNNKPCWYYPLYETESSANGESMTETSHAHHFLPCNETKWMPDSPQIGSNMHCGAKITDIREKSCNLGDTEITMLNLERQYDLTRLQKKIILRIGETVKPQTNQCPSNCYLSDEWMSSPQSKIVPNNCCKISYEYYVKTCKWNTNLAIYIYEECQVQETDGPFNTSAPTSAP